MHRRRAVAALTLALVEAFLAPAPMPAAGAEPPGPGVSGATPAPGVLAVSTGLAHTCVVRVDGILGCWAADGLAYHEQAVAPAGTFTALAAGAYHTCAIRTDGTLACWGLDDRGQATPPTGSFAAVSAGIYTSCGIHTDGTLACWGLTGFGIAPPPGGTFRAVSAGSIPCAIRTDGTLACWGFAPAPPAGTFTAVSVAYKTACAIRTGGSLACWGMDDVGGTPPPPPSGTFVAVSLQQDHACAIRTEGTAVCWGTDDHGEATAPSGTFTAVSTSASHTCAIWTDRTIACWGDDRAGLVSPRPTAGMTALPTWLATTAVRLSWTGTAALATPIYDVRYRRHAWSGGAWSFTSWRTGISATSATFAGSPGHTYCFSVRARDATGAVSAWGREACTAVPLDDRSLVRSGAWTAGTHPDCYRSTFVRSSAAGATLTRTGVLARRIALVATTCAACGSVRVYWGSTLLKTVSLQAATTARRVLLPVVTFASPRQGTLTITVESSGAPVIIDGVAIRRH
jgi:hypothetical protein